MKLAPIVLKIRAANTYFGNNVAGSSDLGTVLESATLDKDHAFVVQIAERAIPNEANIDDMQQVTEIFSVIVVLANDSDPYDRTGITAYDALDAIRTQLFDCLLGWDMSGILDNVKTPIFFVSGDLLEVNSAYLWYQYSFGIEHTVNTTTDNSQEADLLRFNNQWIMSPDPALPITGDLPTTDPAVDITETIE